MIKKKKPLLDSIISTISFNYAWCTVMMCMKMALFHYGKVKDEVKE
jgi:hypothetical protein